MKEFTGNTYENVLNTCISIYILGLNVNIYLEGENRCPLLVHKTEQAMMNFKRKAEEIYNHRLNIRDNLYYACKQNGPHIGLNNDKRSLMVPATMETNRSNFFNAVCKSQYIKMKAPLIGLLRRRFNYDFLKLLSDNGNRDATHDLALHYSKNTFCVKSEYLNELIKNFYKEPKDVQES